MEANNTITKHNFNSFDGFTGELPQECIEDCSHSGACEVTAMVIAWTGGLK